MPAESRPNVPIRRDSPCVGVCRIGTDGLCLGCLRTLAEIAAWGRMTLSERCVVYERLGERRRMRE
ncbi:MAG: DUF1289 domain-containing protein [Gammaproteobacteria bacterium]|nr:DUF1289 domain-containing protein [Gammaproteobacteria bacterium]